MFSFIITLVAIVLVAALSIATLYYGGDGFTQSNSRTEAAGLLQEANQLVGALELHRVDRTALPEGPTSEDVVLQLMDGKYLTQMPDQTWGFVTDYVVWDGVSDEVCLELNKKLQFQGIPSCDDPQAQKRNLCCVK